jgi:endogenous inhibitor of DNA gyrase (YacG/DUF329 family)
MLDFVWIMRIIPLMSQAKKKTCPQCGKPAKWEGNPFRPFCSKRCKMIDLGEWAAERYRIPDKEVEADESKKREK